MIKLANSADVVALHQLEVGCFATHAWTPDMLDSEINNTFSIVLAYTNTEGDIVGYLSARLIGNCVEIGNIAVYSHCRRQGIARKLLETLATRVAGRAESIMLEVNTDNVGAIALYNSCGYVVCNKRHNFYAEGRYATRDAFTMILTLQ